MTGRPLRKQRPFKEYAAAVRAAQSEAPENFGWREVADQLAKVKPAKIIEGATSLGFIQLNPARVEAEIALISRIADLYGGEKRSAQRPLSQADLKTALGQLAGGHIAQLVHRVPA